MVPNLSLSSSPPHSVFSLEFASSLSYTVLTGSAKPSTKERRNTMNKSTLENITIAYTAKTSEAVSPEDFIKDYERNLKIFDEIIKKNATPWLH